MASNILPFCIISILLTANLANGLTCYNCNSKDSVRCEWGIASFTYPTEECTKGGIVDNIITPKCFKITAENKEGKTYIARGCSPPGTIGGACSALATTIGWISTATDDDLRNLSCETCETDKCNSATKITAVSFGALVLSIVMFLL